MSAALDPAVIKYKLEVYKKAYHDTTADQRLILLSANDTSCRPLTHKILENEQLMCEIRGHIRNPEKSIMLSYICTEKDLELRNALGIRKWFGSSRQHLGTKSGSRKSFAESGVPIAKGLMEPHYTMPEMEAAILQLWKDTEAQRVIVKMDDGSGGYGNVVLDFGQVKEKTLDKVKEVLKESTENAEEGSSFKQFKNVVEQSGVIAEELLEPPLVGNLKQTTPSVQLYIHDENEVEVLSSHEQVVNGCIYLGCRYPANKHYLQTIINYSKNIGKTLAKKGVRGFLGVDFLANQKAQKEPKKRYDSDWDIVALEINLRLCATTFSYFLLMTIIKEEEVPNKHYVMLDELHINPRFSNFRDLDAALASQGLAFDSKSGRGVVLGTCGRISSHHEVSVLVVADSRHEVDALLDEFLEKFADEERKHFVHSRSSTPIAPANLSNNDDSNVMHSLSEAMAKEIIKKSQKAARREVKLNEQGVAI